MSASQDDDDLFDDGENFDDFEDDAIVKKKPILPLGAAAGEQSEEGIVDEERFRESFSQFTQRTQRGVNGVHDNGTPKLANNAFERFLESIHCEVRQDENEECYFYFTKHLNHMRFVQELTDALKSPTKCEKTMTDFEAATVDRNSLKLYLAPTRSSLGRQDTVFRALLLSPATQAKAFEVLMINMQRLGKEDSAESEQLSLACVAQMRYLDCVFDSNALLASIIDRDLEDWRPAGRDELIKALPEILCDAVIQEEAALKVHDLMLRDAAHDPTSFRTCALYTLQFLRTSPGVAREIRSSVLSNVMKFESTAVPQVVSFALKSIDLDKEKNGLFSVLSELADHLKIDRLKTAVREGVRVSVDDVMCELFANINQYMQIVGNKGWKDVTAFLKSSKKLGANPAEVDPDTVDGGGGGEAERSDDGEETETAKMFNLFDVFLSFALLTREGCPLAIATTFKNQVLMDSSQQFMDICKLAFKFKKFISTYGEAVLNLSRQFIWNTDGCVRALGSLLYAQYFVAVEKQRKHIMSELLSHLGKQDNETTAVLGAIETLVEENIVTVAPFITDIHKCFDFIELFSLDNGRRFFNILVSIYTKDVEQTRLKRDVEETISSLSRHPQERHRLWAVIGTLIQMRAELMGRSPSREEALGVFLDKFDEVSSSSPVLRSIGYQQLIVILRECRKCRESRAVLAWTTKLQENFQNDFFEDRQYLSDSEFEDAKYRTSSTLWLKPPVGRWTECVPLFELLKEVSLIRQRWCDDDSQMAEKKHWEQFEFVFDANISMTGLDVLNCPPTEMKEVADTHYHIVQWIRVLLNTFSTAPDDASTKQKRSETLQKKFLLMVESVKCLVHLIRTELNTWTLPSSDVGHRQIVIVSESHKATLKRSAKPAKKPATKRKKKGGEGDGNGGPFDDNEENPEENENNEENPQNTEDEGADEQTPKEGSVPTFGKLVPVADLNHQLKPLKLVTVVKLLRLFPGKRKVSQQLCDSLLEILRLTLPKREKKTVPWADTTATSPTEFHGDANLIWLWALKSVPTIVKIIYRAGRHFKEDMDVSLAQERRVDQSEAMSKLMTSALQVLETIISFKEVSMRDENTAVIRGRMQKRQHMLEIIEKSVVEQSGQSSSQNDDAEVAVVRLVNTHCEICPTLEVAVALLGLTPAIDCEQELRDITALHALTFLGREWTDGDGKAIKGALLTSAVKSILEHYLRLRSDDQRLAAILWLTTTKLSDLTPTDSKRVASVPVKDSLLTRGEERRPFASINKTTFPACYKVIFGVMNTEMSRVFASANVLSSRHMTPERCAKYWDLVASVFTVLACMIRVPSLRTSSVLSTACREGKRFLTLMGKNSSFIVLLEQHNHNAAVQENLQRVLRGVQQGNRILQNISVYAKTLKSTALLRVLPELKAASELFIRSVQSAIVRLDCADAFTIGLLKSRNIDGDEIREEDEDTEMTEEEESVRNEEGEKEGYGEDRENGGGEEQADGDADESKMSDVY